MKLDWLQVNLMLWVAWGTYWFIQAKKVNQTKEQETSISRLLHLLPMALAFTLLFGAKIPMPGVNDRLFPASTFLELGGTCVTLIGLLYAVWARVHLGRYWSGLITLKEGHRLIRTGPYQFTHHPIYTGFFIAILGSALTLGKVRGVIAIVIALIAHLTKIRKEERALVSQFGDEYLRFKAEVKTLVPFVF